MLSLTKIIAVIAIIGFAFECALAIPIIVDGHAYEVDYVPDDAFLADKRSPSSVSSFSGMGPGLPSRLARFDPAWRHVGLGKRAPRTVYNQRSYAMIGLGRR